jgi:hypothetical protein
MEPERQYAWTKQPKRAGLCVPRTAPVRLCFQLSKQETVAEQWTPADNALHLTTLHVRAPGCVWHAGVEQDRAEVDRERVISGEHQVEIHVSNTEQEEEVEVLCRTSVVILVSGSD